MTRKEAKDLLPIIQAFAEGKEIEGIYKGIKSPWFKVKDMNFDEGIIFRIKPEPKYRPFANAEECWTEMQKHQPIGWVKLKDTESGYYMLKGITNQVVIGLNETLFSYKKVFEDYTFADGTPFGILEED